MGLLVCPPEDGYPSQCSASRGGRESNARPLSCMQLQPSNAQITGLPSCMVKARFNYAISFRAGQRPASELVAGWLASWTAMEFCLSRAILLVSSSLAGCRPAANRSATRFELSRHVEIARTCLRQVGKQVCDQLASWSQI